MDGLLKVALDVDLLAQLHKHTGHPRVLTDRQFFPLRKLQIVPQQAQGLFGKRPGLLPAGAVQGGDDVGGQVSVGLDTQLCHRVGDGGGGNGTHTDALFLRVFSIVPNFAERGKGWTKKMPRRRRGIEKNDGPGADWGRR